MMVYFGIFFTALFLSLLTVPLLRNWALSTGNLDEPNERKVHTSSVPRLGGVAIFFGFSLPLLLFADLSTPLRGIFVGASILFVTGLIDDFVGLSARKKFVGEILGVAATIFIGELYISELGNIFGTGNIVLPLWLAIPFTLFAVVGVINAINLIDGLDGLSGGVTVIALCAFTILGLSTGNLEVTLISIALTGAVVGFLRYNLFPAKIFMGDVGSLVIGFVLAFLAVHLTQAEAGKVQATVPLLILGLPIVDTIRVMAWRLLNGSSPFKPDMNHIHHRLMRAGFGHQAAVKFIYACSVFWAVVAVVGQSQPAWLLIIAFVLTTTFGYWALFYGSILLQKVLQVKQPVPAMQKRSLHRYGSLLTSLVAVLSRYV